MDKVAIYARVSTNDGKQDYDRQVSDLTRIIIQKGYKENQIDVYAEKISGYKKERPELNKLLSNVEQYKSVFVSEISRIGRNPSHTRQIIDELSDKKIPVYVNSIGQVTLNEYGERNSFVSIALQILIEFADQESQTTKSRMKSGKLQRKIEGRNSGNNPAFGYTSDENKMLVIDYDESIVVEQIFEMYSEGLGSDAIAKTLNQMGIPTRYNKSHANKEVKMIGSDLTKSGESIKWEGVTIRSILKNTIYKGQRKIKSKDAVKDKVGNVIVPAEYMFINAPSIISEELFNQCNELLTNKTTRNFITSYEYLLRDLAYCGCCGKKYYGQYSKSARGAKVYKCASYIRAKGCGNTSINISLIESVIFNEFLSSKMLLSILENPNDLKLEVEKELKQLELQQKILQSDKEKKEVEQSKLLDLYLSSSEMNTALLNKKQATINKELESIESKLHLVNKGIFQKKKILANYNQEQASIETLTKAKDNRNELYAIFKQMIHKVIINGINSKYTLVTLFIKIKGVVVQRTLKLFIDAGAVRNIGYGRTKEYKYLPVIKMDNEPVFKDNILKTNSDDMYNELIFLKNKAEGLIKQSATYSRNNWVGEISKSEQITNPTHIEIVPEENWLMISDSDK